MGERTFLHAAGVILCVFLCAGITTAQTWEWQNPLPQGNTLTDVTFMGNDQGWAAGDCGTILHTTDGGDTWTRQHSGTVEYLTAVAFLDPHRGFAVGWNGTICRTTNGGQTWLTQHVFGGVVDFEDVVILNDSEGWIVGDGVYRTTDGGEHWSAVQPPHASAASEVVFVDESHGWIRCYPNTVLRTTDGGSTWESHSIAPGWSFSALDFIDPASGWVTGYTSARGIRAFRTTDGGITWVEQSEAMHDFMQHLDFVDENQGWGIGFFTLVRTTDGGVSWQTVHYHDYESSYTKGSLAIFPDGGGWMVGRDGRMARSTNGVDWVDVWMSVLNSSPVAVAFQDSARGILAGYGFSEFLSREWAELLHTTDGGAHWQSTYLFYNQVIRHVYLRPSGRGWALATEDDRPLILRTDDAGDTWMSQSVPDTISLVDVEFADDEHGWAVGGEYYEPGIVLHTTNGGGEWTIQHEDPRWPFRAVSVVDAQTAWVAGGAGHLQITTDGGATWQEWPVPAACPSSYIRDLVFTDPLHGWVTCGDYYQCHIVATTDGGLTWADQADGLRTLDFVDRRHGLAMGDSGLARTTDGGATWVLEDMPASPYDLVAMDLLDSNCAWAVGHGGTILRADFGETPVQPEPTPLLPERFHLTAYPNPFNPATVISFDLPMRTEITLAVYDLTGRLVTTLVEGVLEAGSQQVVFDGAELASGIYFARLEGAGFSQTQKLVLLK